MSRKDYVLVARMLKSDRPIEGDGPEFQAGYDWAIRVIAKAFMADNLRFNEERFIEATI